MLPLPETVKAGEGGRGVSGAWPLEVHEGDQPVTVGTVKARTLLAALLLHANRMVPIDEGRMRQRYVNGHRKAGEHASTDVTSDHSASSGVADHQRDRPARHSQPLYAPVNRTRDA
jgi:hypothetical protein